jgi:hypothetical protein
MGLAAAVHRGRRDGWEHAVSPDDFDALFAESRDEPAFSNSDEGYGWTDANCATCIHDKPSREGDEDRGCPLILITLLGRRPAQFVDGPRDEHGLYSRAGQYRCTEYRHEDDDSAEPQLAPTLPGQGELLPREPFGGHRMLIAPEPAAAAALDGRIHDTFPSPQITES